MPAGDPYTTTRAPLIRWGKPGDGQGERLAALVAVLLAVVVGSIIASLPAAGDGRCRAEDEVRVRVLTESNDSPVPAGDTACVHIDAITEAP